MCSFTVYVHACGHYATGPVLSNACLSECEVGPVPAAVMKKELSQPYYIYEDMEVDLVEVWNSYCWECDYKWEFCSPEDAVESTDLSWHVPEVACLGDSLFRPINFNPSNKDPKAIDSKVSSTEDAGSARVCSNAGSPMDFIQDFYDCEQEFPATESAPEQSFIGLGLSFVPETIIAQATSTQPQNKPTIKPRAERQAKRPAREAAAPRRLLDLRHTKPPLPTFSRAELRRLNKLNDHISTQLESTLLFDADPSSSSRMTFNQPIWDDLRLPPLEHFDNTNLPSPLYMDLHNHDCHPTYIQELEDWQLEAEALFAHIDSPPSIDAATPPSQIPDTYSPENPQNSIRPPVEYPLGFGGAWSDWPLQEPRVSPPDCQQDYTSDISMTDFRPWYS